MATFCQIDLLGLFINPVITRLFNAGTIGFFFADLTF
jgi:hypothetical protein